MLMFAAEEEQNVEEVEDPEGGEDEEGEEEDEGVEMEDVISHIVTTHEEQVTEETSPAMADVLMEPRRLHLPGFEEVEKLALLLMELADDTNHILIPVDLRKKIESAADSLHDIDRSARNFVKAYESKWGYTLFGRCLGADSAQSSSAQKTKFGWMRYSQAARITEESRLLYLLVKMLKNKPPISQYSSPTKAAVAIKAKYKRIVDRVQDDAFLCRKDIALPNINTKSVNLFLSKQDKKTNLAATKQPQVKGKKTSVSDKTLPDAPTLPSQLDRPSRPERIYDTVPHVTGKRKGEKRRLEFGEPEPVGCSEQSEARASTSAGESVASTPSVTLAPKPPVLLILPAQPQSQSVVFKQGPSGTQTIMSLPPVAMPPPHSAIQNQGRKPCSACKVPRYCGGLRRRYKPKKEITENNKQKIFSYCPTAKQSITPGFEGKYESFNVFCNAIDDILRDNAR